MNTLRSLSPVLVAGGLLLSACSPQHYGPRPGYPAGGPAAAGYPVKPALSPALVQQVQATLQQQGLYKGNVDGIWGPATQSAVASYQQSKGLAASGQLDLPTLASLNIPNSSDPNAVVSAPSGAPPSDATVPTSAPPPSTVADLHGFTEAQARQRIQDQGYTLTGGLLLDSQTGWHGMATKDSKTVGVALDTVGNVIVLS